MTMQLTRDGLRGRHGWLWVLSAAIGGCGNGGDGGAGAGADTTTTSAPVNICDAPPLPYDPKAPVHRVEGLVAASSSACALLDDGSVRCWGENARGQVGDGSFGVERNPAQVKDLPYARQVTIGASHTCAVTMDHCLWCWGDGSFGQIGTGDFEGSLVPVQVPDVIHVREASAWSLATSALIEGGAVYWWGFRSPEPLIFSKVPALWLSNAAYRSIQLGRNFACALREDGAVECWGENNVGQLGTGDHDDREAPIVVPGLTGIVQLGVDVATACAVDASGSTWCWGQNDRGQVGNGTTVDQPTPQQIPISDVEQLSMSKYHSCVVTKGGLVSCWGDNYHHEVSPSDDDFILTPAEMPSLMNIRAVATGNHFTCVLKDDHDVLCWGYNMAGQLGNGTWDASKTPVPVVWDPPTP